jgi:hypothetical protein
MPEEKVAYFGTRFAARTDIYALRHDNLRTGKTGWVPATCGGFRNGVPHGEGNHLPLTAEVLAAHLSAKTHIGLYPLLDGEAGSRVEITDDRSAGTTQDFTFTGKLASSGARAGALDGMPGNLLRWRLAGRRTSQTR